MAKVMKVMPLLFDGRELALASRGGAEASAATESLNVSAIFFPTLTFCQLTLQDMDSR